MKVTILMNNKRINDRTNSGASLIVVKVSHNSDWRKALADVKIQSEKLNKNYVARSLNKFRTSKPKVLTPWLNRFIFIV